ncbi:hypothetical protein PCANC_24411 [Puccinia coronata f. sp. avenae]|uniref:Uncharacterized protein n=1 Tax=Puccinia coronata f. sp. avenae TaxID=200324 RepID=A0A2N5SAB6_9BASI|nr:hypothetical protein PCANC_24411 [Puccinia coronata f. sp. avenae]PLW45163.1 hypothetical protein PCASD_04544 [Puccinia coronata f. sp. avenae]
MACPGLSHLDGQAFRGVYHLDDGRSIEAVHTSMDQPSLSHHVLSTEEVKNVEQVAKQVDPAPIGAEASTTPAEAFTAPAEALPAPAEALTPPACK